MFVNCRGCADESLEAALFVREAPFKAGASGGDGREWHSHREEAQWASSSPLPRTSPDKDQGDAPGRPNGNSGRPSRAHDVVLVTRHGSRFRCQQFRPYVSSFKFHNRPVWESTGPPPDPKT